jgi:hypothetical protein
LKTKLTILLLIISTMTLYSQYFFDDYSDVQKLDIAHAYLMVSQQYDKLGDSKQSDKFKDMALFIYPDLMQKNISEVEKLVSSPEKTNEQKATGPDRSNMIKYYFSKLLRSVITGDLETADSLIAERLYIPEYNGGLTKAQLRPMALEINKEYNLSKYSPSDLYKLDTINVVKLEEGTYLLTIEGADNKYLYTSGITFFGKIQTFRFRNFDSGWKIDKITATF